MDREQILEALKKLVAEEFATLEQSVGDLILYLEKDL